MWPDDIDETTQEPLPTGPAIDQQPIASTPPASNDNFWSGLGNGLFNGVTNYFNQQQAQNTSLQKASINANVLSQAVQSIGLIGLAVVAFFFILSLFKK